MKTAEYRILINGIEQSIDGVNALNKQLGILEEKLKTLSSSTVTVSGGKGSSSSKGLSEEEKIARQIEQIDAKREAYSKQIYQNYLAAKDVLKDTVADQKEIAAQERLTSSAYTNTMAGLKQELADIKQVLNTTDFGDSEMFNGLVNRANEITNKLKEIEQSYGQFGRNVGNYANGVAEGLQKVRITVGNTVREFSSAREASRTLNNELKAMALNGQNNTKEYQDLNNAVKTLKSTIDDVAKSSVVMDNLLDTMQSISSIGAIMQGGSAFLGFDNKSVQESIRQLMALQTIMQGIEKLNIQLQSQEFMGGWFSKGVKQWKSFVDSLFMVNKEAKASVGTLNTLEGAEIAVGTAGKTASVGVRLLSTALKALPFAAAVAVIVTLIAKIGDITDKLKEWARGNADVTDSEKELNGILEVTNDTLDRQIKLIEQRKNAGVISDEQARVETEEAYAEAIKDTTKSLNELLETTSKMGSKTQGKAFADAVLGNTDSAEKALKKLNDTFHYSSKYVNDYNEAWKKLSEFVKKDGKNVTYETEYGIRNISISINNAKDQLVTLEQIVGGEMVKSMQQFDLATEDGKKALADFVYNLYLNGNEMQKSVLLRLPELIGEKNPALKSALDGYLKLVNDFADKFNSTTANLNLVEDMIKFNVAGKTKAELERQYDDIGKTLVDQTKGITEEQKKALSEQQKKIGDAIKNYGKKTNDVYKKNYSDRKTLIKNAEENEQRLRLRLMDDGLRKTLYALEQQNKKECEQIRKNGVNVENLLKLQGEAYAKERQKILDDYNESIIKSNRDLTRGMTDIWREFWKENKEFLLDRNEIDDTFGRFSFFIINELNKMTMSEKEFEETFDDLDTVLVQLDKQVETLGIIDTLEEYNDKLDEIGDKVNDIGDAMSAFTIPSSATTSINEYRNTVDAYINDIKKKISDASENAKIEIKYDFKDGDFVTGNTFTDILYNYSAITKSSEDIAVQVMLDSQKRMAESVKLYEEYIRKASEAATEEEKKQYEILAEQSKELGQTVYNSAIAFTNSYKGVLKDFASDTDKTIESVQDSWIKGFDDIIDDIKKKEEKALSIGGDYVKAKGRSAIETLFNVEEANNVSKKYLDIVKDLLDQLSKRYDEVKEQHSEGLISDALFKSIETEIFDEMDKLTDMYESFYKNVRNNTKNSLKALAEVALSALDAAGQLMDAFDKLNEAKYEKEKDRLERETELLEEQLQKQQDITQRYADKVNSIEDELAGSRGDRRQMLIDALNAEQEAQRQSLAEEKRIEKEQEKLKKQEEKLEKEESKRKKNAAINQSIINTALSIGQAANNPWPMPALAMVALATALGAVQLATIKNTKYASGGVIEGPSHSRGGVKVLGGTAEVEGGEFITNKKTTRENIDLLSFINTKREKVDLSDLITFFSSKSGKSITKSSPRSKFADGGMLPSLRTDIDFSDRILKSIENYNERPIQVSVVDIINKQNDVRTVRTLAGAPAV